jgi:4-amino-4-deoxy-L-arabinose transferase-like glycosyltransferase
VPPSLFGDELDVGYQAYSILKTGKDYSGRMIPLQFRSFTEYRTPLYLYSAVPTVAVFGITPLGVRLPAVFFGVCGVIAIYLLVSEITGSKVLGTLSSLLLAVSPWHIHYSRAGFEVTLLLSLFIFGLYFFLRGLRSPQWFIPSAVFLVLTPWAYSTAQLYLPLTIFFLLILWSRNIFRPKAKGYVLISGLIFLFISIPYAWSTYFGGGTDRFSSLSIFNNPVMEGSVGEKRFEDGLMLPLISKIGLDRVFHNKYVFFLDEFGKNYVKTFSTEFLFLSGDGNPRHNSSGTGELYTIEAVLLLIGLHFLYKANIDKRKKWLVVILLLTASIPSSLTIDGSNHATRLILLLIPLTIIISYGLYGLCEVVLQRYKKVLIVLIALSYLASFVSYQHFYWIHFPLATEKSWQYGWQQVVNEAMKYSGQYQRVIISSHSSPAYLYFLAWSQYSPVLYQRQKDFNTVDVVGFGKARQIGNVYFPLEDQGYNLYNVSSVLDKDTLYVVPFDEFKLDLIKEPMRLPLDLSLVQTVKYLSGEPAFYFITKK